MPLRREGMLIDWDRPELVCLVPAGGYGSRLGRLTEKHAKPSLPVAYDADGEITRMVDIPLEAIRMIGGKAVVTTFFAAHSLQFVSSYEHVTILRESGLSTSADMLLNMREDLQESGAETTGIIPGDARISAAQISDLYEAHIKSKADATLLATHHTAGHNIRHVDQNGMMVDDGAAVGDSADLGIHLINTEWLLDRLTACSDRPEGVDIWDDVYDVGQPAGNILLHVPADDKGWVDMGTPVAYFDTVTDLNSQHANRRANIVFPGARLLNPDTTHTIALPNSSSELQHSFAILPEDTVVTSSDQTLQL